MWLLSGMLRIFSEVLGIILEVILEVWAAAGRLLAPKRALDRSGGGFLTAFGRSWGRLGAILAPSWAVWAPSWAVLELLGRLGGVF